MGWVMGGIQYQMPQCLSGRIPWQGLDIKWQYTSVKAARAEAGFEPMGIYIW